MFYRFQGWVQNPLGEAISGASVAALTQPANTSTQPGTPLAQLYAAGTSNSGTISAASWAGQQLAFTFVGSVPADVLPGSYILTTGFAPDALNDTWLVISINGLIVSVMAVENPGAYVSGGDFATSVLPNPLSTDGNGYYFAYTAPGLYTLQIYSDVMPEIDYPDQPVGTVAGGSVLSVGLTMPADFVVGGSPVTTTGVLAVTWTTQSANKFLSGPASGSAATPTWRNLVTADLPAGVGSVTSVGFTLTVPAFLTAAVTGSPVTASGTLAATLTLATQSANFVFAGPTSGSAAAPVFRLLVVADIPVTGYTSLSSGLFVGPQQDSVTTLTGSTDAILFPGSVFLNTAGVDACSLSTPASPGDDGKILRIFDESGHSHTVTTASNKIVPAHSLITFNGTIGSFVELEAKGGLWFVGANSGVVIS